ncbi:MAG: hypothetical protein ACJ8AT_04705 [Hyalangium sp.]|uniref:hypothetical protein n=1 Tax=Hyalangium sp. TaxID=2028555 RepID=UPI00389ABE39
MSLALLPLVVLVLLVPFLAVSAYALWKIKKASRAAWAEFAHNHGMLATGFRIEGSYEDYPLVIETARRGHSKHRYTVTVLSLSVPDALPPEFSLALESLGDKVLHFLGKKDERIGDADFDKFFEMENLSPALSAVLRHMAVQEHLYEMVNQYQTFHIRDGWIHAERRHVPSTAEELEEFVGPALMLAHTLEETSRRTQRWAAR